MSVDDDAVARAKCVLAEQGLQLDDADIRKALAAALTPADPIEVAMPVSVEMVKAGREAWLNTIDGPPAKIVTNIFRAMLTVQNAQLDAAALAAPAQSVLGAP